YDSCTNGTTANIGNGQCDEALNTASCGFDGGDCCPCTCSDSRANSCTDNDFNCFYPDCGESLTTHEEDPITCVEEWQGDGLCHEDQNIASCAYDGGDFPACTGNWNQIRDGYCDAETNVPSCGYDGGDVSLP
ncbi:unnamed protein product, partial [Hapterophycus canaliculatus]